MPGELIALGAAAAAPQDAFVRPLMQFWASLDDPSFIRSWCAHWNWAADLVPMTGALLRDLIVELYRNNSLFCGELTIAGRRVDLRSITANLLNVIAMDDHVSPPCQSRRLLEIVGSRDKQELRVPGTHVESMAGFHAPVHTWPSIRAWLDERSNPTNSTDR